MRPADTSPKIWEMYCRRLAELTPAERVNMVAEMVRVSESLQRAVLRKDSPDATEDDIVFQIAVRRYGEAVARKVYGK